MSNMYKSEKFSLEKVENKIQVIRNIDGAKTQPVEITEPIEEFSKRLVERIVEHGLLDTKDIQTKADEITTFIKSLIVKKKPAFEFEEFKPSVPVKPKTAVPITEYVPPEKPKPVEVDTSKLVMRYQELNKASLSHDMIIDILIKENPQIKLETIKQLLPEIKPKEMPSPAPKTVPIVTSEKLPVEEVPELPKEILDDYNAMSPSQKDWLGKLSQNYRVDMKTFILRCIKEAEQSKPPMLWLNRFYQYAITHNLVAVRGERCIHSIFAHSEGTFEATINPEADLKIDQCYVIGETGQVVRCIARSIGTRRKGLFPNLPHYTELALASNVDTIPLSYEFVKENLRKLKVVYDKLLTEKELSAYAGGIVTDIGQSKKGNVYYLTINDGSPLEYPWTFSIELPVDNPFNITETKIKASLHKPVTLYGFMKLVPASEAFSRDTVKIIPEWLWIGE